MTNSASKAGRPGEFELIAELFAPLARSRGALGLADDAAVISSPPGCELVITTDALVEGVHFLASDPADLVARKALRVNLSDLAAKGSDPVGYLLVLSIPESLEMSWLRGFAAGLEADQQRFEISLFGGDTTSTPGPLTIAVTAFGEIPSGKMLRRAGARPGDLVYVSGTIGDAGGGLACLRASDSPISESHREFLIGRYRLPQPRVALGRALLDVATSSIDISDGLLADLAHVAEASNVRIAIEAGRIPLSPALHAVWPEGTALRATTAGDDYEIAFTVPAAAADWVAAAASGAGILVTNIGFVGAGSGAVLLDQAYREIPVSRKGFTHF